MTSKPTNTQKVFSWSELPRPFFILAPMEAVTDVVFRTVIDKAAAPDIWFTEFTNATGWNAAGEKAIGYRLVKNDNEYPIIAQLWGSVPEAMSKLSKHCAELGYHGIDLNMGCPDSSAVKSGGGAGMIKTPDLAAEMIAAAKESGLPVSVKTRLGFSSLNEWQDWLTHILKQDVVNLTIHLRTKREMSKVEAHHELIPEIIALRDEIAPQTTLTVNGDIKDYAHGMELYNKYPGLDGIMIGRGIFHNPYAFSKEEFTPTKHDLLGLLLLQLDLHDEHDNIKPRKFDPLKRFFKIYVREFDGAAELRDALMHTKDTNEVRAIIQAELAK